MILLLVVVPDFGVFGEWKVILVAIFEFPCCLDAVLGVHGDGCSLVLCFETDATVVATVTEGIALVVVFLTGVVVPDEDETAEVRSLLGLCICFFSTFCDGLLSSFANRTRRSSLSDSWWLSCCFCCKAALLWGDI